MNKPILFLITLTLISTFITSCGKPQGVIPTPIDKDIPSAAETAKPKENKPQGIIDTLFFEEDTFTKAITFPQIYEAKGKVVGGVVPHHLLASDMIAGFFSMAAAQNNNYDTIFFVSPSHFPENANNHIVTTTANWNTPFGIAQTDQELVSSLMEHDIIKAENNSKALELEHGIGGLIPFANHYFPNSKVVTLLLSNKLQSQRLEAVWEFVGEEFKGKNILLIASADFSHYLTKENSATHDEETKIAIENLDINRILKFKDSNVDSPQAITTFIKWALAKEGEIALLDHSSSEYKLPHDLINPVYFEGLTTYFIYGAFLPFKEESNKNEYINNLLENRLSSLDLDNLNDFDKIKVLYTDLVEKTYFAPPIALDLWQYKGQGQIPPTYLENRSLSILEFGIGSCEDYSAYLTLALRKLGLEAKYMPGLTLSIENQWVDHAWVAVKIEGNWYHLDPQLEDNITKKGILKYKYFLRSDMEISNNHIWGENLISFAKLDEVQAKDIRENYLIKSATATYPTPREIKLKEPTPPVAREIEAKIEIEKQKYIGKNGTPNKEELNITPPIFGDLGFGPPD